MDVAPRGARQPAAAALEVMLTLTGKTLGAAGAMTAGQYTPPLLACDIPPRMQDSMREPQAYPAIFARSDPPLQLSGGVPGKEG